MIVGSRTTCEMKHPADNLQPGNRFNFSEGEFQKLKK